MSASRKICNLQSLLAFREQARQQGQTVVHCHGCFDIVHPGHIKHLEFARSLGDLLVVSVSADTHVNKGVNRPLIPDDLRAASLAALECVDAVYVNPHATAVELLDDLQPDIFVKGREYEKIHDPRFIAERDTVMKHGGRVVFSSGDVVYSSTAIINDLEDSGTFQNEKLRRLRERYDLSSINLQNLIHRFRGQKVVVIGDYIQDCYHHCDASGVASEGPMMSLRQLQTRQYDGGAAVIALHMAAMGADATLITSLADDENSRQTEMRLRSAGIDVSDIQHRRSLVAKHRYIVDRQKLMKVDEGGVTPVDSRAEQTLIERIFAADDGASAVVLADFGYGLISGPLLEKILPTLRKSVPILTADVSGRQANLMQFRDVDLLCPTEREIREAAQDFTSGLNAVVWNLLHQTGAKRALITLGKQGLLAFDFPDAQADTVSQRLRSEYLPAITDHAVDPLGCGDALLATATLALSAGGSLAAAAYLGSVAASIEVQLLGNHPISAERMLQALSHPFHATAAA